MMRRAYEALTQDTAILPEDLIRLSADLALEILNQTLDDPTRVVYRARLKDDRLALLEFNEQYQHYLRLARLIVQAQIQEKAVSPYPLYRVLLEAMEGHNPKLVSDYLLNEDLSIQAEKDDAIYDDDLPF